MRQVTTTVYNLNELSADVRQKVIKNWRDDDCVFLGGEEIVESLKGFCDYFSLKLDDYALGGRGDYLKISPKNDIEDMGGARLLKWIEENIGDIPKIIEDIEHCRFTGACYDFDIAMPMLQFLKNPSEYTTFGDIISDCGNACLELYRKEIDYWHSDEAIIDEIDANDYEFTESGDLI